MVAKKALSEASKLIVKDGTKEIVSKVIPVVAAGVATIAVNLIKK